MMRICVAVIIEPHVTITGVEKRVERSENHLVETIKSLLKGKTSDEKTRIMELVQLGNDDVKLISARKSGSIALYFHCKSLHGLLHLHHLLSSGRLQTIVEAAFNGILRSCDAATFTAVDEDAMDEIGVFMIRWPNNEFNKCKEFLQGKTGLNKVH